MLPAPHTIVFGAKLAYGVEHTIRTPLHYWKVSHLQSSAPHLDTRLAGRHRRSVCLMEAPLFKGAAREHELQAVVTERVLPHLALQVGDGATVAQRTGLWLNKHVKAP